ncbi:uncharacterized protein LOC134293259 isoform X2 [Anolis carolinensis]|uniref:uncharacterized protein LOC134293259 isoform X2 n=1 Tax=Anolis carolinensis TaxID=28377 RepID=UPI002F2B5A82
MRVRGEGESAASQLASLGGPGREGTLGSTPLAPWHVDGQTDGAGSTTGAPSSPCPAPALPLPPSVHRDLAEEDVTVPIGGPWEEPHIPFSSLRLRHEGRLWDGLRAQGRERPVAGPVGERERETERGREREGSSRPPRTSATTSCRRAGRTTPRCAPPSLPPSLPEDLHPTSREASFLDSEEENKPPETEEDELDAENTESLLPLDPASDTQRDETLGLGETELWGDPPGRPGTWTDGARRTTGASPFRQRKGLASAPPWSSSFPSEPEAVAS